MPRKQRDPKREAAWRKRFADWKASGLGAREFCRRRKLKETGFYFWRRELMRREQEGSSRKRVSKPKELSFATIEMQTPLLSGTGQLCDGEMEIGFPSGRHIRFHAGVSLEALKEVIHIVESTV